MDALSRFVPVYVLAKKMKRDYHTLLNYIHSHPELEQCQKDADDNMVAFAKGKLMSKVSAGHAASIMFLLERLDRKHFGRYNVIENVGELPSINIGVFEEKDFVEPMEPSEVSATGDASEILRKAAQMADAKAAEDEEGFDSPKTEEQQ